MRAGVVLGGLAVWLLAVPGVTQEAAPPHRPSPNPSRFDKAIGLARGALEANPGAPMLHYSLGTLLLASGDLPGAIAELQAVLERLPEHVESLRGLARAHALQGELEAALPYLKKSFALRPGDAEVELELGRNLLALGRLDEAEPRLRAAAEALGSAPALSELGLLYRRRGELEQAAGSFRRALALDPRHSAALFNYGQTLLLLGRRVEGERILHHHAELATAADRLERYESANQPVPTTANYLAIAQLHRQRGHDEPAMLAYLGALELDPELPAAVLGVAELYLGRRKLEQARPWVEKALTLAPRHPRSHFVFGILCLYLGQPRVAERAFAISRELGEWSAGEDLELGEIYRHLGDSERAAAAFESAVRRDPQAARGYRELAREQWLLGKKAPARASIDRATALDDGDGEAWMLAGIMYFDDGDRAETAFRNALAAQTVALLAENGVEEIVARFSDLPGAAPALELYRRLQRGSDE